MDTAASSFVGRQWLFDRLGVELTRGECRIVLLTGSPGVGKTAFLDRLASGESNPFVFSLRRNNMSAFQLPDVKSFLLMLGVHLARSKPQLFADEAATVEVVQQIERIGARGEAVGIDIGRYISSPFSDQALSVFQDVGVNEGKVVGIRIAEWVKESRQLSVEDLFELALARPFRKLLSLSSTERLTVYVDGIDEIDLQTRSALRTDDAGISLLDFLCEFHNLPENLRMIVASRPTRSLERLKAMSHVRSIDMDEYVSENAGDVGSFIRHEVARLTLPPEMRSDYAGRLKTRSAGNFLYATLALRELGAALSSQNEKALSVIALEDASPQGLPDLYRSLIARLQAVIEARFDRSAWSAALGPLLGLLAIAKRPLSVDELSLATGIEHLRVSDIIDTVAPVLTSIKEQTLVALYHTSLAEYILENNSPFHVERRHLVNAIHAEVVRAWGGLASEFGNLAGVQPSNQYFLEYLNRHLLEEEQYDAAQQLACSPRILAFRVQNYGVRGIRSDIAACIDTAASNSTNRPILSSLLKFLKAHGAWIDENADAFLPQLVEWYYRSKPTDGIETSFLADRVQPVCRQMFPNGCLWSNEFPSAGREVNIAAGSFDTELHHGVCLPDETVAVSDEQTIFILDEEGAVRRIRLSDGAFIQALFALDGDLGVVASVEETSLAILKIKLQDGSISEVQRHTREGFDEVVRGAAATTDGDIHLVTAVRGGSVHHVTLSQGKEPEIKTTVVPGFVTSVTFHECFVGHIYLSVVIRDDSSSSSETARVTATHQIYRWISDADLLDLVFSTRLGLGTIVTRGLQGLIGMKHKPMGWIHSPIHGLQAHGQTFYFSRGSLIFRLGFDAQTAVPVYGHSELIRGLVDLGEGRTLILSRSPEMVRLSELRAEIEDTPDTDWPLTTSLPNDQVIILGTLGSVSGPRAVFDPETGRTEKLAIGGFPMVLKTAAVNQDGAIALLSVFDGIGGLMQPWAFGLSGKTGRSLMIALTASPDGGFLGLESDGTILILEPNGLQRVAFSIEGRGNTGFEELFFDAEDRLVVVNAAGLVLGIDHRSGKIVWDVLLPEYGTWLRTGPRAGALPNNRIVACDTNGTIRIWNRSGKIEAKLFAGFSPSSLSASARTGQITVAGPGGRCVAFSMRPDPIPLKRQDSKASNRSNWRFPSFPRNALRAGLSEVKADFVGKLKLYSIFSFIISWFATLPHTGSLAAIAVEMVGFTLFTTIFIAATGTTVKRLLYLYEHVKLNRALRRARTDSNR